MYVLAGGPFGLGPLEIGIILIVVVLIFGVGKVADLGGALGKSVREFRRNVRDDADDQPRLSPSSASPAEPAQQPAAAFCSNCGAQLGGEAKFCAKCGAPRQAAVS
jgi:sec-independent protein translocase protein TatA